ncbi:uncharacterized protein [Lepeophtheirus salmonis]|uniref:uncharacterized protein n=1 Tax=Lepeophtheirus salmonis TaxID=72036 RepID=UPI001AE595E0|nr:uncharacterized protein LOC121128714 [Lepeophtheirus salmonis]
MQPFPRFSILMRYFHASEAVSGSKKDYKALKKLNRRRLESHYERIDSSNPFKTNIGVANSLKFMELNEKDPGFETGRLLQGPEEEEIERLGDEVSEKRQRSVDKHYKQLLGKNEIKHIMEMKKLFPKPKDPNLLTWIEKETIRYLNKMDPNTWTPKALSESFTSADEIVIKKVLKSGGFIHPDRVDEHDKEVFLNWKLLKKDQLPIRSELKAQILSNNGSFQQPNAKLLPTDVTSQVIANNIERFAPLPRKIKKGPFGSIISEYKHKTRTLEREKKEDEGDVHILPNLFKNDQLIFDEANINEPSPYRETALLDTSINLSKEPHMTANEFKEVYFKSKANKENIELVLKSEINPIKRKYFQWIQEETVKSSHESEAVKLDADEIIKEIK